MDKETKKELVNKSEDGYIEFKIPDIGTGRLLSTTTRILMDLMPENGLVSKMGVLNSVIEYLEIEPDDFKRYRRNLERWRKLDYDNDEKYSFQNEE